MLAKAVINSSPLGIAAAVATGASVAVASASVAVAASVGVAVGSGADVAVGAGAGVGVAFLPPQAASVKAVTAINAVIINHFRDI